MRHQVNKLQALLISSAFLTTLTPITPLQYLRIFILGSVPPLNLQVSFFALSK
jgi:hypothetical protein